MEILKHLLFCLTMSDTHLLIIFIFPVKGRTNQQWRPCLTTDEEQNHLNFGGN